MPHNMRYVDMYISLLYPIKYTHILPIAPTLWMGGQNPYPQRV